MAETPAEAASRIALEKVYDALDSGRSFRLEAGAGAGKTYSLIKALQHLINRHQREMPRRGQQIACITYTNVAKEEIEARIDRHPVIRCDTNHAFCWSLISPFQKQLRELLTTIAAWEERVAEVETLGNRRIDYNLGYRSISDEVVTLHHDDILPLTIRLMENIKFRRILTKTYPIILIDEYQDTDTDWVEAIKEYFLSGEFSPQFGFFGDHWQKIYGNGCGELDHPALEEIGKEANFRSVQTVIDKLNAMRPELPQFGEDPASTGEVLIFHTNQWPAQRRQGSHWAGDLPEDAAHAALEVVTQNLSERGWDLSPTSTKMLMLTHRGLAAEQGYPSLPGVFRYGESYTRKEHPYITYFVDLLEPAAEAFSQHRYGEMFEVLGTQVPSMKRATEKKQWSESMLKVCELREEATVGDVIDFLKQSRRPRLSDSILTLEAQVAAFDPDSEEEISSRLEEIIKLRAVPYSEIVALRRYLLGHSPFETKHGVKGAEFENVVGIIGRGWNQYNFNEMLELASAPSIPAARQAAYERNRNLFYVVCSRPRKRLALLFTQLLSDGAIGTLKQWFGENSLVSLQP